MFFTLLAQGIDVACSASLVAQQGALAQPRSVEQPQVSAPSSNAAACHFAQLRLFSCIYITLTRSRSQLCRVY